MVNNQHRFVIDTLYNVDFSIIGPVEAHCPKSRPYRTAKRHVVKVSNNETMVEFLHGSDTNAMIENDDSIRLVGTSANFKGTTHELRGAPSGIFDQPSTRKTALLSPCT